MTQEERDNLLLGLVKGQENLLVRLECLEKGQEGLIKGQERLTKVQENLLIRVEDLEEGLKETNYELRKLSQAVAVIEQEHGSKLQLLLDIVTSHEDRFSSINKRLDSIEDRLDKQDDKIYYLNSKVQAF